MELSPRLKKIADLIPKGSILADIGTDHAYLPAYCVKEGICPGALAMDVNKGPLKSAEQTVNQYGISDKIELRLADGINGLRPNEANVIVIAGMGGLLIKEILKNNPEVLTEGTTLILQPMLAQKELRQYLFDSGNAVTDEYLAKEGDKVYNIIVAKAGLIEKACKKDIVLGRNVKQNSFECYGEYTDKLKRILNKIILGQKKSKKPDTLLIQKAKEELDIIESEA